MALAVLLSSREKNGASWSLSHASARISRATRRDSSSFAKGSSSGMVSGLAYKPGGFSAMVGRSDHCERSTWSGLMIAK
ncbi:hypothetical protein N799_11490 [Lysobacter arseniciresistens ZS79]|uniref:Uncharacterized protein n=1 Tax=Lysobacter arseniciresistens ZS79 TaxID=913325 RepID=A0A0A0ERA1_9GAMM|nr:hypothetical protein N799_11490 [Lysobacter arseniciresistens ZS79]